jgi:hypothetical protein
MVNKDAEGLAIYACSFVHGNIFIKEGGRKNKTIDYWLKCSPLGENSLARSTGSYC